MALILTGFGPYGKFKSNLSAEIVKNFVFNDIKFHFLRKIIPVSWKRSIITYNRLLLELHSKPELVILLGIHSVKKFYLERIAWNFKIGKDVDGRFNFGPIKIYFAPWIKTILDINTIYSIIKSKINISVSNFPGFYLCNHLYYWALRLSNKEYPVIFIHIPQKGNLSDYINNIKIIIKTIMKIQYNENLQI